LQGFALQGVQGTKGQASINKVVYNVASISVQQLAGPPSTPYPNDVEVYEEGLKLNVNEYSYNSTTGQISYTSSVSGDIEIIEYNIDVVTGDSSISPVMMSMIF
jgi:hypothetical protein